MDGWKTKMMCQSCTIDGKISAPLKWTATEVHDLGHTLKCFKPGVLGMRS